MNLLILKYLFILFTLPAISQIINSYLLAKYFKMNITYQIALLFLKIKESHSIGPLLVKNHTCSNIVPINVHINLLTIYFVFITSDLLCIHVTILVSVKIYSFICEVITIYIYFIFSYLT